MTQTLRYSDDNLVMEYREYRGMADGQGMSYTPCGDPADEHGKVLLDKKFCVHSPSYVA